MSYKQGKNGMEYQRSRKNTRIRHRAMIEAQEAARAAAQKRREEETKEKEKQEPQNAAPPAGE